MIMITGASGQLGSLVINKLIANGAKPDMIVAIVRNLATSSHLSELGVNVRVADYNEPESLENALGGVTRVLLVSSSEVGQRTEQHKNVINAAKKANVELLAYTSILHADTSPLSLAKEHRETETALAESGIPYVLLRNGWYSENYTISAASSIEHGVVLGCAKNGKLSTASRADYAEAAARIINADNQAGKVYELAGDESFTLEEYARYLSEASGAQVTYNDLSESEFSEALTVLGLPSSLAKVLADSDVGASQNGLFDDSKTLSSLIGRPTETIQENILKSLS